MKELDELEHEKLRIKMDGVKASQEAASFMIDIALKEIQKDIQEILVQTTKTNGRVTQLENDYSLISTLRKNKWLILLISIGIFKIYELIDLNWIFQKLISLF